MSQGAVSFVVEHHVLVGLVLVLLAILIYPRAKR